MNRYLSSLPYLFVGSIIGFLISELSFNVHPPKSVAEEHVNETREDSLFDRYHLLTYMRSDALKGKWRLEDMSDDASVSASNIKWVALALEEIPKIQTLALEFQSNPNVGTLRAIYQEVYNLSNEELEIHESSAAAKSNAMDKLQAAISDSKLKL